MARVKCFHCKAVWDLASATNNRCPKCGWFTEIFYDKKEAETKTKRNRRSGCTAKSSA